MTALEERKALGQEKNVRASGDAGSAAHHLPGGMVKPGGSWMVVCGGGRTISCGATIRGAAPSAGRGDTAWGAAGRAAPALAVTAGLGAAGAAVGGGRAGAGARAPRVPRGGGCSGHMVVDRLGRGGGLRRGGRGGAAAAGSRSM